MIGTDMKNTNHNSNLEKSSTIVKTPLKADNEHSFFLNYSKDMINSKEKLNNEDENTEKKIKIPDRKVVKALFYLLEKQLITSSEALEKYTLYFNNQNCCDSSEGILSKRNIEVNHISNLNDISTRDNDSCQKITFDLPSLDKNDGSCVEIVENKIRKSWDHIEVKNTSEIEILAKNDILSDDNKKNYDSENVTSKIAKDTGENCDYQKEVLPKDKNEKLHESFYKKMISLIYDTNDKSSIINGTIICKVASPEIEDKKKNYQYYECAIENTHIKIIIESNCVLSTGAKYKFQGPFNIIWIETIGLFVNNVTRINKAKKKNKNHNILKQDYHQLAHFKFIKFPTLWKFMNIEESLGFPIDTKDTSVVATDDEIFVLQTIIKKTTTYVLLNCKSIIQGTIIILAGGYVFDNITHKYKLYVPKNVVYETNGRDEHFIYKYKIIELLDYSHAEGVLQLIGFWNSGQCNFNEQYFVINDKVILRKKAPK